MTSCPFCDSTDVTEESFAPYAHEDYTDVTVIEKAIKCNACSIGTMCRGTKPLNNTESSEKEWGTKTISKKLINNINSL